MIAVIGAGISGLTSALTLQRLGHSIIIIDKGRSVGGRLATRYHECRGVKRYIDTASHYIELTEETPQVKKLLLSLYPDQDGKERLFGSSGVNSIAKKLSEQLKDVPIVLSHKVSSLSYNHTSKQFEVNAISRSGEQLFQVDGVILTAPVPQSIELLESFPKLRDRLRRAPSYHRCLLLLLWPKEKTDAKSLKKPAHIDRIVVQNHIQANQEPIPIAVHATYEWSDKHYDCSDEEIMKLLLEATGVVKDDYDCLQVKRWGQAQPIGPQPASSRGYEIDDDVNLVVCSDALGAGNIHYAGEAGIEAATELAARVKEMHAAKI